ncbi:hypothetical protein [Haloarchaeobius sp. DT45]|uniref:hypothetical protein n=1 Tax=Haloarchaeobius sp. DT45 TaxID=3446116 RepID=UPI003F6C94E7
MTEDRSVSRRQLLYALTGVGAIGTARFAGTRAAGSDVESLFGSQSTGSVDLAVCWQRPDAEQCQPLDGSTVSVRLDGITDTNRTGSGSACVHLAAEGNDAWLWVRSNCPDDPCGLFRDLEVSVFYDLDGDGVRGDDDPLVDEALDGVSLCEAMSVLRQGIVVDGDPSSEEPAPVAPGDLVHVGFEWTYTGPVVLADEVDLSLLFVAQQARHTPAPTAPFTGTCDVDCDALCEVTIDGSELEWVAFCSRDDIAVGDVSISPYSYDSEGAPTGVRWTVTNPDVDVAQVVGRYPNAIARQTCGDGTGAMASDSAPDRCLDSGAVVTGLGELVVEEVVDDAFDDCPCLPGTTGIRYEVATGQWTTLDGCANGGS